MNKEAQEYLQAILAKSVAELNEYEIAFLRARQDPYLTPEQKAKFAAVLGIAPVEVVPEVTQSVEEVVPETVQPVEQPVPEVVQEVVQPVTPEPVAEVVPEVQPTQPVDDFSGVNYDPDFKG